MVHVLQQAARLRARYALDGPPTDDDLEDVCAGVGLLLHVGVPELVGSVRECVLGQHLCIARGVHRRERRWLIAHGLGHWLMHEPGLHFSRRERGIVHDQQEWQAEAFAGWLLLADPPTPPLGRIQADGVAGLADWAEVPYAKAHAWVGTVLPQYAYLGVIV
jgi:hypothetical protein